MRMLFGFLLSIMLVGAAFSLRPRVSNAEAVQNAPAPELLSQVSVARPGDNSSQTLDSPDEKIYVDPGESVSVNAQLTTGTGDVELLAPNGGAINDADGKAITTPTEDGRVSFSFQAGTASGHYTVEMSRGQSTEILEFWVGPEPPLGQPGPSLTFTPAP
jgi:hypothetical protein